MTPELVQERIESYVELQRQLGRKFRGESLILRDFGRYLAERYYTQPVSQELVMAFATNDPTRSAERSCKRFQVVRRFAQYLAVFEPETSTIDPRALRRHRRKPVPFVFTDQELARLMAEARRPTKTAICSATHHTAFGLAASTGLRVSEIINLDKADVDFAEGVLQIRNSKFRKSRVVPAHPTTMAVLRRYAALRDDAFPGLETKAFFISTTRRDRYETDSLTNAFFVTARRAGIRRPNGKVPTLHSLRHTFAVRRLIQWYREDADVQTKLPALATYMGHVHYTTTAYYLTATPELMALAAERAARARRTGGDHGR